MKTTQNIQDEFTELAASWGEAIKKGDSRTANRNNSAVTKITKKFKKDKVLGEKILIPLFYHLNPSVRLLAVVHALDLDIHSHEVENVLSQIAGDPNIHVISLMAKINLQMWNEKKPI